MNKDNYWKNGKIILADTKRFLGMPITFTKYKLVVSDEWCKLFVKTGIVSTIIDEVNLFRIYDIQCVQTLGQKIFNVGSITLFTKDITNPVIVLHNVKNPYYVRNMFAENIEKERASKGVRVGELY